MLKRLLIAICLTAGLWQPAAAQTEQDLQSISDGPYLFYEGDSLLARWVDGGSLQEARLQPGQPLPLPPALSAHFAADELYAPAGLQPQTQDHFGDVDRILAISDTHGQYDLLRKFLQAHGVTDEAGNWAYGKGHLVVLGDIFDRGEGVTESLWLVHQLERQAQQAGGRVHFLLGNHEVMALMGDLRYINRKYRYTMALLQKPYDQLFAEDTYLGQWLRSKPVAISINDIAFVHAGISGQVLQHGFRFSDINTAFQQKILRMPEDSVLAQPELHLLYGADGPLWYRGYFEKDFKKRHARGILRELGQNKMIVGHTSFEEILALHGGRIYCIDSSIKLGEGGEVLLIEDGQLYTGSLTGKKSRLK